MTTFQVVIFISYGMIFRMPDYSQQIQSAKEAIQRGDKDSARQILQDILMNDPNNPTLEQGWYFYSQVAENKEEAIYCIQKVLEFNPNNQRAKFDLAKLQGRTVTTNNLMVDPPQPVQAPVSRPAPKKTSDSSQQNTYLLMGGVFLTLIIFCGIAFFISYDSIRNFFSPAPVAGNIAPTSTILPSTPEPPTPSYTERADCICSQVNDYLNRTGERYVRLLDDINEVDTKLNNRQEKLLDYNALSANAKAIYQEQIADVPPPCLQGFQSKTNSMFWNWQQAMEYANAKNYEAVKTFMESFTEQVLGLKAEAGKIRQTLEACPDIRKEADPVF